MWNVAVVTTVSVKGAFTARAGTTVLAVKAHGAADVLLATCIVNLGTI
jgi:hypothetical protein